MLSLEGAKKHYKKVKALWDPLHTEIDNIEFQRQLSNRIGDINYELCQINREPQPLRDYKDIRIPQAFLHHYVEKEQYKRRNNIKVNVKKHIPDSALVDGCHVSLDIAMRWVNHFKKISTQVSSSVIRK